MSKRIALLTILSISIFLVCITGSVSVAYADSELEFDKTYVLDDLEGSAVDGVPFTVADYPYDKNGDVEILGFAEYGYSAYSNMQENFGLYIYLYNPALLDISDSSCKIQIGVGLSNAADYNKYYLKILSKSTGTEANRFIKMKVVGADKLLSALDPENRRYYVSGIEMITYGSSEIVEYNISQQYCFSGYSKGYGTDLNAESTLVQTSQELDSVEITGLLDRQTVYRDNIGNPNVTSHNQVNGVYFGLDKEYFNKYGFLQKIKAEWYEYRTTPIVVVGDQTVYDAMYKVRGVNIGECDPSLLGYGLYYGQSVVGNKMNYQWAYNAPLLDREVTYDERLAMLGWIIKGDGNILNNYTVPESVLKNYRAEYENIFQSSLQNYGSGTFSTHLFSTDVGNGRSSGYNLYEFDAQEDAFDFTDYGTDPVTYNGWQKFKEFFGWTPQTESVLQGQSPIFIIDSENITSCFIGNNAEIARRLLIDESEVDKFRSYCNSEIIAGHNVVHFRFACTEYVTKILTAYEHDPDDFFSDGILDDVQAFYAEENVFLNFDVLSLTFKNDDGDYRIFPVINDPIDIISGIVGPTEPPTMGEEVSDWWQEMMEKVKDFFGGAGDEVLRILGILVGIVFVIGVIAIVVKIFGLFGSRSKTIVKIEPDYRKKRR